MPIEPTVDSIDDLNPLWPTAADPKSEGDDHIRNIKQVLKDNFPNIKGPMPVAHDQVASKADIAAAQFSTVLPAQVRGFLRSDGAVASFGVEHTGYAQNEVKGADITSAAELNLTAATGNFVHITGTTAITGIAIPIGADRTLVFDGVLTLTHGAGLLLPTGANITTQPGDRVTVRGDTSGAIVTHYQRADGTALFAQTQYLTLLGTATISAAVANIDFLNIFSADYDKYLIEAQGLALSTASLNLALAKAGAVDSTFLYGASSSTGTAMSTSAGNFVASSIARAATLSFTIRAANDAASPKGIAASGWIHDGSDYTVVIREGLYRGTSVVTGFRLFSSGGGNFTAGTVRLYGVLNS